MSVDVQFLNKTARYAIAAVSALAELEPGVRISSGDLAARTDVPRAFLGKVLTQLSRQGLVDGLKGHGGGYRLARPAEQILLSDVVLAFSDDQSGLPTPCALGALACDPAKPCAVHHRWLAIRKSLLTLLDEVTVAEAAAGNRLGSGARRRR